MFFFTISLFFFQDYEKQIDDKRVEISYTQVRVCVRQKELTDNLECISPLQRGVECHHSVRATVNYVSHLTSLVLVCV